jgi:hypothetical protein
MFGEGIVVLPSKQVNGEEMRSTQAPNAAKVGHCNNVPVACMWCNALCLLHPTGWKSAIGRGFVLTGLGVYY